MDKSFLKKESENIKILKWKKMRIELLLDHIPFHIKYPITINLLKEELEELNEKINKLEQYKKEADEIL